MRVAAEYNNVRSTRKGGQMKRFISMHAVAYSTSLRSCPKQCFIRGKLSYMAIFVLHVSFHIVQ